MAFLLSLAVVFSVSLLAFADSFINNQIISGSSGASAYIASTQSLFNTASNAKKIQQPYSYDYYSSPFSMYISAPKGHSVYVYDYWAFDEANRFDAAYHGSRVTVLAGHGAFYCVLYFTQKNELKAGWVNAEYLVSYYPGNTAQIGRGSRDSRAVNVGDPDVSWSRENFVRTTRKFTILNQAVSNVVSFTLDYQVTARNGSQSYEVYGPRDVYVNDGSGWVYVGSFDYPTIIHPSM